MNTLPKGFGGFVVYGLLLACAVISLPSLPIENPPIPVAVSVGMLAAWRYSWGLLNFIRGNWYNRFVFPRLRRDLPGDMPPKIYLLLTLFRIETETAAQVIHAAVKEAIAAGVPVNIITSIVEFSDELLIKNIFSRLNPPEHVTLTLLRIPGTGKREALAQGFRAISRDVPPRGSVVALIDGDTVLTEGLLKKCVPFFMADEKLGALTTDEICHVKDNGLWRAWHNLRFAQRHLLMGSLSLSKRLMTLTGRMSMYRADIITNPDFINHMLDDHLEHWRMGRFRFLTGDDKSSLYWVLKQGYAQMYVPDVHIVTLEDMPGSNFFSASSKLMFRWFGNMLRTNERVIALGPRKMPFFIWWAFIDQRLSMWTTLCGPLFALMLSLQHGWGVFLYYMVWVGFTRGMQSVMLTAARPVLDWRYPFLLYYNQIYGSLLKTWVLFRLDRQSWTRQKTSSSGKFKGLEKLWFDTGSGLIHSISVLTLICAVGWAAHYFSLPRLFLP